MAGLEVDQMTDALSRAKPAVARAAILKRMGELYRASLYKTAKHLCGYADVNVLTHGQMIAALEAPTKRKLIVMPRGTFKSSVGVVAYAVWLIINNPNIRILIDSEKYENSKNFIREIKGKLTEKRASDIFGSFQSKSGWNEGEITVAQRTRNLKEATVTASGIGAGKTGQHYDVILWDDLNTEENSQSAEMRQKIIRHYRMNISILEPDGIMSGTATRYAVDDVVGHILDNEVNVKGLLV